MPRLPADIRISIKNNKTGEIFKIELIRLPNNSKRFWVRFNGKKSQKLPEGNLSEITARIRRLLKNM